VFLGQHKTLIGVDLTYEAVWRFATSSRADAIQIPLLEDFRVDIPSMIRAIKMNYRDIGIARPHLPQQLHPIHVRHSHVGENDHYAMHLQLSERFHAG